MQPHALTGFLCLCRDSNYLSWGWAMLLMAAWPLQVLVVARWGPPREMSDVIMGPSEIWMVVLAVCCLWLLPIGHHRDKQSCPCGPKSGFWWTVKILCEQINFFFLQTHWWLLWFLWMSLVSVCNFCFVYITSIKRGHYNILTYGCIITSCW
jgi:hypothetical protein